MICKSKIQGIWIRVFDGKLKCHQSSFLIWNKVCTNESPRIWRFTVWNGRQLKK